MDTKLSNIMMSMCHSPNNAPSFCIFN